MNKKRLISNVIAGVVIMTMLAVTGCGKLLNKVEKEPEKKETVKTVAPTTTAATSSGSATNTAANSGSSSSSSNTPIVAGEVLDNSGGVWFPARFLKDKTLSNLNKVHLRCKGSIGENVSILVENNGEQKHLLTSTLGDEGILATDIQIPDWATKIIVVSKDKTVESAISGSTVVVRL